MTKKDLIKIFIDEIYNTPPSKHYETKKIIYNHIDEIWSFDLADMIYYKISNNKGYRYIIVIIDVFSECLWALPLKIKHGQTIANEVPNISSTSKRRPLKLQSDRGAEFYKSVFQNFLRAEKIQQCSRLTDKRPPIAERGIRNKRILLKKPVFENGTSNWLSELSSVFKKLLLHTTTR